MNLDKKLKQALLEKLSHFHRSMPVYSIKKLSYEEMIDNSKYYALRFTGSNSDKPFRIPQKKDDLTLINLSMDTKMRIYHHSNTVTIHRKMNLFQNEIGKELDKKQLSQIAINEMNRLELDKLKLSFEHVEFERLWQIKSTSMTIEKTREPVILLRIVGAFRRYINKIPVFGGASIFIKIAGGPQVQSIGIHWRQIKEKPINNVRIIDPNIAADKLLKNLNSSLTNNVLTLEDYKPEFFALGYFSLSKRHQQNYMQPVYIAIFKSVRGINFNRELVIPASTHAYEPVTIAPEGHKSKKKIKR
jgi:hypothetical protein